MRRSIARLCTALLLAGALPLALAAPALAQDRTCFTSPHWWAGKQAGSATELFDRVVADINVPNNSGQFSICEPTPTDWDDNGPSAWVAVQAGPNNPQYGNENAIFQVGIIKCSSFGEGTCDGDGAVPSFFWAFGGCGEIPTPRDLGPADYGVHEFKVAEGTSSWYVYIDGTSRASILKTDSRVSCWISGDNNAAWFGEKWDKGDSFGDTGTYTSSLLFDDMQYSYDNNPNFITLNTTGLQCSITDPVRDFCGFGWNGTGSMYAYTDQP